MKLKTLSIVLPVYNEEKFIQKAISKVLSTNTSGFEKEIIVVDDGSTDNTVKNIRLQMSNLKKKNKGLKISNSKNKIIFKTTKYSLIFIRKIKNEGKGSALKSGFLCSTGDIVLIQDADLEYNPDDYVFLLEPFIKDNADVVYGSRFISNRPHRVLYFWHSIGNFVLTQFSNMLTNLNLTDMETGFKVFKGKLIRQIAKKLESKRFGFEPEITARIAKIKGLNIYEVGISYRGRTYEEGKKIGWRDGVMAIWEIIKFNLFAR